MKKNYPFFPQVLSVIKALCSMNACRHELEQITGGGFQSRPPRGHATYRSNYNTPPKMMRGSGGYRGPISNSESYGGGSDRGGNCGSGYRGGYNNRGYGMGNSRGQGGNWNGGSGFRGRY